jgi:pimeloyl-ACP methyl ester carboxylesterase
MEQPIIAPVLQVHGLSDGAILPRTVDGSDQFVLADYQRRDLPGIGHFPQEEDPDLFADVVLEWLATASPLPQHTAPLSGTA